MENIVVFLVIIWLLITISFSIFTELDKRVFLLTDIWRYKERGDLYITETNGIITASLSNNTNIFRVRLICWNVTQPTQVYLINSDRGVVIDFSPSPGYKTAEYNLLEYNNLLLRGNGLNELNNISCVFLGKEFAKSFLPRG